MFNLLIALSIDVVVVSCLELRLACEHLAPLSVMTRLEPAPYSRKVGAFEGYLTRGALAAHKTIPFWASPLGAGASTPEVSTFK
jgi:hypothetical protein